MTTSKAFLSLTLALLLSAGPTLRSQAQEIGQLNNELQKALELAQPQVQFTRQAPTTASNFVPEGEMLQNYHLGVGDSLDIYLWNARINLLYPITIGPEGTLLIPKLGSFNAVGLNPAQLRQQILQRLAQVQKEQVQVTVSLTRIRQIQVLVSGFVQKPGYYPLPWGTRLIEALRLAGGVRENGSVRRIKFIHQGQSRDIDLFDFQYQGLLTANPPLTGGEQIQVPLAQNRVALVGQVQQPGLYEIKPGENLNQLLQLAGGLKPTADPDALMIWPEGLESTQQAPHFSQLSTPYGLQAGDVIYLQPRKLPSEENQVQIYGLVRQPGAISFRRGLTLQDCLKQTGGPLPTADLGSVKISRQTPQGRRELVVNLQTYLSEGRPEGNPAIEPGDIIMVPETFFIIRNITELTTLVISALGIVSVVINLSRGQ